MEEDEEGSGGEDQWKDEMEDEEGTQTMWRGRTLSSAAATDY
jgi:hypothetical protein